MPHVSVLHARLKVSGGMHVGRGRVAVEVVRGSAVTGRGAGIGVGSDPAEDQSALDLLDRLGDLDAARAGLGAVEGRAAAPHAFLLVEDLQALVSPVVAGVEDEPMRVDDGSGA